MPDFTPERIRQIREHLGLTQRAFGNKIGVTDDSVSRWERGIRKPTNYEHVRILNRLDKQTGA